ncbi:hypothetical protein BDW74DRAFT_5297 [Aspergillus multicolor]|uniref:putative RNA binding protein Pym n=1 Tax=Aspergillus multicolor TaxID=41759 RepID=UPI003CCCFF30
MATPNSQENVTKSGITTDAVTGERYIPSSVRADGSKRKEIKVRPGYRPPEDVELYRNRAAAAWKNRGKTGGVPGAEGLTPTGSDASKPVSGSASAASNKNAKRREAKKKAKAETDGAATTTNGKDISQIENWRAAPAKQQQQDASTPADPVDPEVEREKKARNLKKKLKQARELSDKKNQGEALLPEQLEKVIKIQELIRQLDALGFDANGEDKKGEKEEKPEK